MHKEMTYYLYHIPGKKIGVTRDLNSRVVKQQGYDLDEIEVLDQSTDIEYISNREIELQKSYGYRVDLKQYKELYINKIKSMHINATEQTSTFPCPVSKLKGRLMDNIGKTWETLHGTFEINKNTVKWIMNNVSSSQFTTERCYIYNKAFAKKFLIKPHSRVIDTSEFTEYIRSLSKRNPAKELHTENRFDLIRRWATERDLYKNGDTKTQFCKLMEEGGELGRAILKKDQHEFVDAIGDMVVVLTNLAHLGGTTIEQCIDAAYAEIKTRKGKMLNGTFVKND